MHPFEAMAEPIRRRIIEILASGEHPAGVVTEVIHDEYRVSRSAVSRHLRVLRESGFVDVRPDLNVRYYRLRPEGIDEIVREAKRLRRLWRQRVDVDSEADPFQTALEMGAYVTCARVESQRGRRGRSSWTPPRTTPPDF